MPNTKPIPHFNPEESYNVALRLHNQEFRTLSERTNIFLISQSIFVAALAILITSQQHLPIALDIPALGIILAGILYCLLHHRAGLQGASGAFILREYMIQIEKQNNDEDKSALRPWEAFYRMYRLRRYSETLLEKPPLPSSWLFCPTIFLGVWFGALSYVISNHILAQNVEELAKYYQAPCWLFSILAFVTTVAWFVTLGYIIYGFITWYKTKPLP